MNDDDLYDVDGDARDCEDDGDGDGDVWCAEEFGVCQSLCPVTECDGAVGEVGRWGGGERKNIANSFALSTTRDPPAMS